MTHTNPTDNKYIDCEQQIARTIATLLGYLRAHDVPESRAVAICQDIEKQQRATLQKHRKDILDEVLAALPGFRYDEDAEQSNSGAYEYHTRKELLTEIRTLITTLQERE